MQCLGLKGPYLVSSRCLVLVRPAGCIYPPQCEVPLFEDANQYVAEATVDQGHVQGNLSSSSHHIQNGWRWKDIDALPDEVFKWDFIYIWKCIVILSNRVHIVL